MNSVQLVGRLTKDVDLRTTTGGKFVASGTIACNRKYTNAEGKREADFINFVVWGKQAENMANYTRKGHLVGMQGELNTRSYENKDGQKVFVTEVGVHGVTFLEPKKESVQA